MTQDTKTQHTPGPWYHSCDEGNDPGHCNVNAGPDEFMPDGYMIATVEEVDDGTHDEQREANARLIAAAPELLAALEDARDAIASLPDFDGRKFGRTLHVEQIDAAIRKARGE